MSSTLLLWQRGVRRGVRTAAREHQWVTAFGVLFGVLLLVQLFIIGLFGVRSFELLLRERTDLRLEIQSLASDQHIREFFIELESLPAVASAVYITKEQALASVQEQDPSLSAFINEFGMENPFPDTISLTLRSLEDYRVLRTFIEEDRWNTVVDPSFLTDVTDQESQVFALLEFTQAGRSLVILILVVVGGILMFTVTEIARRRLLSRKEEVLIERLVGAHPLTIFLPFATEATLLLWIAIVASGVLSTVALFFMPSFIPAFGGEGIFGTLGEHVRSLVQLGLPVSFAIELLLAPLIASAGIYIGLRKHMHSTTLSL